MTLIDKFIEYRNENEIDVYTSATVINNLFTILENIRKNNQDYEECKKFKMYLQINSSIEYDDFKNYVYENVFINFMQSLRPYVIGVSFKDVMVDFMIIIDTFNTNVDDIDIILKIKFNDDISVKNKIDIEEMKNLNLKGIIIE